MRDVPSAALAAFLLGFSGQLFIEHNTLYALLASLVLLAWYILEQRRFSLVLFFHTAGCVLGTALLFSFPSLPRHRERGQRLHHGTRIAGVF